MVNRNAVVVKAKTPFLDWTKALPDPEDSGITLEQINEEANVYLLPQYWTVEKRKKIQEQFYLTIFEMELFGWWTDEADWPRNRNLKIFHQWFDLELYTVIEDLVDEPLLDDD